MKGALLGVALSLASAASASEPPLTAYTTTIWGAPFPLKPGDRLAVEELRLRLGRLRYKAEEDGSDVRVSLRGFSHPLVAAPALDTVITLKDGRIEKLATADGAPVLQAWLEPEQIYELSGPQRVRREPVGMDEIPKHLVDAIVAIEDRRFFSHFGLDFRGLARAAWRDVRERKLVEGGSTLTQQLARNLYLTPRRTLARKLSEAAWALYLEARYSKNEILRMYLDQVYFGQDGPVSICGIKTAAKFFFDKEPRELTLGESALMAGMLASPYRFNPFRSPDDAMTRRRVVLRAMRDQGYLTESEETKARLEPLKITRAAHAPPRGADYFVSYVQEELERRYPDENLVQQGLTIHTTLDPLLQQYAEKAVSRARYEAALIALNPATGAIRALVGGKDFARSPFNRAIDARRQPGSAFKPFAVGAALEAKRASGAPWNAASVVVDEQKAYPIEGRTWTPKNFDGVYHGTTTVRDALALSLNGATLKIAQEVGPRRIMEFARRLGVASELQPNLGLALGDSEVTLVELTGAYAAIANGGARVRPFAIEAVLSRLGDVLEYRRPETERALGSLEAWLLVDLLREPVRSGTAKGLAAWGLAAWAAGKTGTTDGGRDAWFVGFTPSLAAGVWSGTDLPSRLEITGASAALPVWAEFMKAADPPPHPDDAWPRPPEIEEKRICPSTGLLAKAGCPTSRVEVFLPGTAPASDCTAHPGGVVGWIKKIWGKKPKASNPSTH